MTSPRKSSVDHKENFGERSMADLWPRRLALSSIALTLLVITALAYQIFRTQDYLERLQAQHIPLTELSGVIARLDDRLRHLVVWGDKNRDGFGDEYEGFKGALEASLSDFAALIPQGFTNKEQRLVLSRSRVFEIEKKLLDTKQLNTAEYEEASTAFAEVVENVTLKLGDERENRLAKQRNIQLLTFFATIFSTLFICAVWWVVYREFYRNVGEKIQAEKEAEEQRVQLIHASKMSSLGEMAGGIAHEINNPLAIIGGHAEIIRGLSENPSETNIGRIQEKADRIVKTVKRASHIIKGLRTFSHSGEELQKQETIQLDTLIRDTLDLCETKLTQSNITIDFSVYPEGLSLECNPVQVSQVLLNLIQNGTDAIQDLPEKWIQVEATETFTDIVITVRDSGRGITPEIKEKILRPFFTTKEVGKGTGLGLSVSHGIIKSHGGTLEIPDGTQNTEFKITLPKRGDNLTPKAA